MRKIMIGLLGAATIALLAMPVTSTDADAHGWHRHGGWRGGGGWRGYYGGYPYYGYRYAGYYPYGYSCYRTVRTWTPYGFIWRRVWVCG